MCGSVFCKECKLYRRHCFGVRKHVPVLPREWRGQKYWGGSWKRIRDVDNRYRGGRKFLGLHVCNFSHVNTVCFYHLHLFGKPATCIDACMYLRYIILLASDWKGKNSEWNLCIFTYVYVYMSMLLLTVFECEWVHIRIDRLPIIAHSAHALAVQGAEVAAQSSAEGGATTAGAEGGSGAGRHKFAGAKCGSSDQRAAAVILV